MNLPESESGMKSERTATVRTGQKPSTIQTFELPRAFQYARCFPSGAGIAQPMFMLVSSSTVVRRWEGGELRRIFAGQLTFDRRQSELIRDQLRGVSASARMLAQR